jgi:hypothetical protein
MGLARRGIGFPLASARSTGMLGRHSNSGAEEGSNAKAIATTLRRLGPPSTVRTS